MTNLSQIKLYYLKVEKLENIFFYLVVFGGKKKLICIYIVSWVVWSEIEDKYDTSRKDWFASWNGLHIDGYKKIKYIDGHNTNLINVEDDKL